MAPLATLFAAAAAAAAAVSAASSAVAQPDLASTIGATNWSPCYFQNESLPVLLDGASKLAGMQTRAIKMVLSSDPPYYWNTMGPGKHGHWNLTGITSIAQLAAHPWYDAVFSNALGTNYKTFVLVAFRFGTGGYFCAPPVTPANITAEIHEFSDLTTYLMGKLQGTGARVVYQHWEGDWASRCGGYNASQPADPAVQDALVNWLYGRQTGTSQGRRAFCKTKQAEAAAAGDKSSVWAHLDCEAGPESAILSAAGVEVYHASEVNLIHDPMTNGFPDNILKVIPRVALDMVSYSSYDTQATPLFGKALDFIASHHNTTSASPMPAVYVGEYGLAQNGLPESTLLALLQNVLGFGLSPSPVYARQLAERKRKEQEAAAAGSDSGALALQPATAAAPTRAAHLMFWELYDNENSCSPDQRCNSAPCFDMTCLRGFWLVRPNGTHSAAWGYLQGVINGSIPVPQPPAEDNEEVQAALALAHQAARRPNRHEIGM